MQPWFEMVGRGAYVTLTTRVLSRTDFELIATWENGQEHKKQYSVPAMEKKPCDYMREFLREILEKRGVA